jgi:hypothetical protein
VWHFLADKQHLNGTVEIPGRVNHHLLDIASSLTHRTILNFYYPQTHSCRATLGSWEFIHNIYHSTMNGLNISIKVPQRHGLVTWQVIRIFLVTIMTSALLGYSDAKPAQALVFSAFTTYLSTSITAFLTAAGATTITPLVTAALGIIPWLVIVLSGSIITWQAYEGYKEYDRENFSGIAKPVANILIILVLLFMADKITATLVS